MPNIERGISPKTDGGASLGSSAKRWAGIFMTLPGVTSLVETFCNDAAFHNSVYRGKEIPYTWAEIKTKVQSGDFSDLYIGDYKEITLTTSEKVVMEIAGINCYKNWGSTAIGNHIDFISRDCLATAYKFNDTATNNGKIISGSTIQNPFQASELYQNHLGLANGDIGATIPTEIKNVIARKEAYSEYRYSSGGAVSADTGAGWISYSIWLPAETEVFDHPTWSEVGYGTAGFLQYPIFRLNPSKIIKGVGNGGSRGEWWTLSAQTNEASHFIYVDDTGFSSVAAANNSTLHVPLCFRVA